MLDVLGSALPLVSGTSDFFFFRAFIVIQANYSDLFLFYGVHTTMDGPGFGIGVAS